VYLWGGAAPVRIGNMARRERSAGVVLYRMSAEAPERREYLLLDYGKHWDFPKGHVEKGETDIAAALRELKEETGLEHTEVIEGFGREIRYFFRQRKQLVDKRVIFFILKDESGKEPVLSSEHVGWQFLPFDKAMRRLTFATARQVLRDVDEFLSKT
jgi:bis(5'-nucleosidyl)-tetraphosphatase